MEFEEQPMSIGWRAEVIDLRRKKAYVILWSKLWDDYATELNGR
jgi:hypothetical protein